MINYQKIIYLVHTLLNSRLLINDNLFHIVIIFLIANYFFLFKGGKTQQDLNKLTLFEIFGWSINTYIVITNNVNLWFSALCNLLWLITSLKIVEVRNNINIKNAVIFLFISIGLSSVFNQDIFSDIIHLICCFLLIYGLLIFNNYKGGLIFKKLITVVAFIPLTFLLYIYLPNVNPWIDFKSTMLGETGVTNKLKPGDISSLVQNEELVGRIYFEEGIPKPEKRYWRVYVLDHFSADTWEETTTNNTNNLEKNFISFKSSPDKNLKSYNSEKWILEPNNIKNLPWSGEGFPDTNELIISSKGSLKLKEPLKKRLQYKIVNNKNFWRKKFSNISEKKIEIDGNKLLTNLGKKWFEQSTNNQEIISKAEYFFRENGFKYTVNPEKMRKNNSYDDFLFNKKSGFCEHFAGSFALLMRAAKVPSRVVVGYQGGQILENYQNQQYLLIDNSYAHAWTEVWLEDKGWTRVDPTEWIAPERIYDSILTTKNNNSFLKKYSRKLNLRFNSNLSKIELKLNNFINKIYLEPKPIIFSKNVFINRLFIITIFFITIFTTLKILLIKDYSNKRDLNRHIINFYLNILRRFEYKIQTGETLITFSKRIALKFPEVSDQIYKLSELYNKYRFNPKKNNKQEIDLSLSLLKLEFEILSYVIINSNKIKSISNKVIKIPSKNF